MDNFCSNGSQAVAPQTVVAVTSSDPTGDANITLTSGSIPVTTAVYDESWQYICLVDFISQLLFDDEVIVQMHCGPVLQTFSRVNWDAFLVFKNTNKGVAICFKGEISRNFFIANTITQLSKFLRRSLLIFIIKGFRTIVFIFIVIFTTFRPICPPAFFWCLSNSGTFTITKASFSIWPWLN